MPNPLLRYFSGWPLASYGFLIGFTLPIVVSLILLFHYSDPVFVLRESSISTEDTFWGYLAAYNIGLFAGVVVFISLRIQTRLSDVYQNLMKVVGTDASHSLRDVPSEDSEE